MASSRNALLKKSKEALDASDWAAALEAATEAVSSDGGGSYQGWAFAGKAAMGLEDYVECERCYRKAFKLDAAKLPALQGHVIVTNPPYGIRMGGDENLEFFYKNLGDFLKQKCKGSAAFVYFGERRYIKKIGLKTTWKKPIKAGGLDGRLVKYEIY